MLHGCMSMFHGKYCGIQVLAGLAPSNQNSMILIETPSASEASLKNDLSIVPILYSEMHFLSLNIPCKFVDFLQK
jgi:hypothetical protein